MSGRELFVQPAPKRNVFTSRRSGKVAMNKVFATSVILFLATVTVSGECQTPKTKTSIIASCSDAVGGQFVFHLREELRKSAGYAYDAGGSLVIKLVCMDTAGEGETEGLSSAIGVLVTTKYGGTWANCPDTAIVLHSVIHVGRNKTEQMATRLLAMIDNELHP